MSNLTKQLVQQIKIPILTSPMELEYFQIHQVRYEIILDEISKLNLPKKSKVLDVGCYPLHLFNALKHETFQFEVAGIASNHEPVIEDSIEQLNIEKDKFPFNSNSFDLVLMTEVIEHLTGNPEVYLSEVKRVLKAKGYLLITTPNAVHLKNRAKVLFGKSSHFPIKQLYDTNLDDESIYHRHNREFTMDEISYLLKNSKFEIRNSKFVSFYTPFREGRKKSIARLGGYAITQLLPQTRDSLLVIAK